MSLRAISECFHAFATVSTATIAVVPAVTNRRVSVYRMIISNAAAVMITIQDTTSTTLSQQFQLPTGNMPMILETQNNFDPWFVTVPGVGLQLVQSGTVIIGYDIWYQYNQ